MNNRLKSSLVAMSLLIVGISATADARTITGNTTLIVSNSGAFLTPSNCVTEFNSGIKTHNRPSPNTNQCNDNTQLSNVAFITPMPIQNIGEHTARVIVTGVNNGAFANPVTCRLVTIDLNGNFFQGASVASNLTGAALQSLNVPALSVGSQGDLELFCRLPTGGQGIQSVSYND